MLTLFRSLILWLALLAVPFQGFAAAAVLPCAPATGATPAHAHGAGGHEHPALHQHSVQARDTGADSGATHGHHAGAKCGTCATACCLGAAIGPPPLPAVASSAPQSQPIPFDAGHLPSVHPTLPDRPPCSSPV